MASKTAPKTLADISVKQVRKAQQRALLRLLLFTTGQLHERLNAFAGQAKQAVMQFAGEDGTLDAGELYQAQEAIFTAWQGMYADWIKALERLRFQAASIPFGSMAVYQMQYVTRALGENLTQSVEYDRGEREITEGDPKVSEAVFKPQLQSVMDAADQRVYSDGLTLSSRIWKLDRESRQGISQVLMQGITEGKSAWQIAQDLEQYLGAGEDCPRWTSTRLYGLTKKEIAGGDRRGLKTGKECDGKGVAYNALRLARTELQAIHHLASDQVTATMPWIEKEQIMLSPAHPKPDICDEVVAAGEDGQGIYKVGTIRLPLHPACLCYKTSVLMPPEQFADQLNGWIKGETQWAGMDAYAQFLGVDPNQVGGIDLAGNEIALSLIVWLTGGRADLFAAAGMGL